jgi:hypothetical protein
MSLCILHNQRDRVLAPMVNSTHGGPPCSVHPHACGETLRIIHPRPHPKPSHPERSEGSFLRPRTTPQPTHQSLSLPCRFIGAHAATARVIRAAPEPLAPRVLPVALCTAIRDHTPRNPRACARSGCGSPHSRRGHRSARRTGHRATPLGRAQRTARRMAAQTQPPPAYRLLAVAMLLLQDRFDL